MRNFQYIIILLFKLLILSNIVVAKEKSQIIGLINHDIIYFDDFMKQMESNRDAIDMTIIQDSLFPYFDKYLNYRLKIMDAKNRGIDKDPTVLNDIAQNRIILAESFFFQKRLIDPYVKRMVKLRNTELKFAYIYISYPKNNDTITAYRKAQRVIELLRQGKQFEDLAKEYSDDVSTSEQGGVSPRYITIGQVQRPIENALFSLNPGEIHPAIIKSRMGYIIVKLIDKEPRKKVWISHILFNEGLESGSMDDTLKLLKKAEKVLDKIMRGANFNVMAKENSDDSPTALNGGNLELWYCRSTGLEGSGNPLVSEFENAIYSLKDGECSGIVKTDYGFHIIRRDSTVDFDEKEESEEIKKLYKRIYFNEDKRILLDSVKAAMGIDFNYVVMYEFLKNIDTLKSTDQFNTGIYISDNLKNRAIIYTPIESITLKKFIQNMTKDTSYSMKSINSKLILDYYSKFTDIMAVEHVTENLEQKYPDFSKLMNEYKDGILYFKVEALEVWNKLKFDTTEAYNYWLQNKNKYPDISSFEKAIPVFAKDFQDSKQKQLNDDWLKRLKKEFNIVVYYDKLKELFHAYRQDTHSSDDIVNYISEDIGSNPSEDIGSNPSEDISSNPSEDISNDPSDGMNKVITDNERGAKLELNKKPNKERIERTGKDYGLLIAIDNYASWKKIPNPINDARAIAIDLSDNYGFNIDTLFDAPKIEIIEVLEDYTLKSFNADDQLLIFFAGHGFFHDPSKQGFFIAKDSKIEDKTQESYIPFHRILTTISNIPCKHILIIMDACFAGTFDEYIALNRGRLDEIYIDKNINDYINKKLKYKTKLFISSTGKQKTSDGIPGRHSPFARKLLEALRNRGGSDGVLTTMEIMITVEKVKSGPIIREFGDNEPGSDFLFIVK